MATRTSLPIIGQGSLRGAARALRVSHGSGSSDPGPGPWGAAPSPSPAPQARSLSPAVPGRTRDDRQAPAPGPTTSPGGQPKQNPAGPQASAPGAVARSSVPSSAGSANATAPAPRGGPNAVPMGFFTDTTICIGCKACEVACKSWNQLPASDGGVWALSGDSYDNTQRLDGIHWRHVKFIEQFPTAYEGRWLLMSDVCKHCVQAGCLEVCPTGAIIRTEFDTVVIQSDACNGCRACIAACPFGVIDINPAAGTAQKCTLCYDRISVGLEPACSKACPTDSIQFGPISELRQRAQARLERLHADGVTQASLYGADPNGPLGGLNSFYLLVDEPEVYGLPRAPQLPSRNVVRGGVFSTAGAVVLAVLGMIGLRKRRMDENGAAAAKGPGGHSPERTTE